MQACPGGFQHDTGGVGHQQVAAPVDQELEQVAAVVATGQGVSQLHKGVAQQC